MAIRMESLSLQAGNEKRGHSEFPDVAGGRGWQERTSPEARGPAEALPGGKRKLTESAREFPKAFRLTEPVRVAPGGAGKKKVSDSVR